MKHFNFKLFAVMLLAAVFVSSCGLNRMVRNYDDGIRYTPEVNPLENHGGEVAADVQSNVRDAYFHRNAVLEITPVLRHEGGEKELETFTLRGSRTTTAGSMVSRDRSSSFNIQNRVAFEQPMVASELYMQARLYREGRADRATVLPERKVADGVIITSQRVDENDQDVSLAPHGYELETIVTRSADIYFAYMRHNLNWRLPLNRQAENQARLEEFKQFMHKGWAIKGIEVNAWASPEGEVAFNEELSEKRAASGETYLNGFLRELERALDTSIDHAKVSVNARGEDFDGFMTKLHASDLPDKQTIANVINAQIAPAERERRIKDMTIIYAEIEKILEPLRRAELVVHAYEPKKTAEEIYALATSDPAQLANNELLYAATLTENAATQLGIYRSAQRLFPNCYRGFNNAAYVLIGMGDFSGAAGELEKANQIAPNNGHVLNNLGVVAFAAGDVENAQTYFESARNQGIQTGYNLGNLMILQGNYREAIASYAGRTCGYNVALAQLMAGNAQAAKSNLTCAPESAAVSYLKAVIAARENNAAAMMENLRAAFAMDASYKEVAKVDREFIRYFAQPGFMEIVE